MFGRSVAAMANDDNNSSIANKAALHLLIIFPIYFLTLSNTNTQSCGDGRSGAL